MAPVTASADGSILLARVSKLRVALRNADHAAVRKVATLHDCLYA